MSQIRTGQTWNATYVEAWKGDEHPHASDARKGAMHAIPLERGAHGLSFHFTCCSWRDPVFAIRTRASSAFAMRMAVLPLLLALDGCSAYATSFTGTTHPSTPITLTRLYVYSFLDIRSEALGPQMMREIARQLGERLESRGVATEQHWFRDDSLAASFNGGESSAVIPIPRVVAGNAASERRFGADYRLVAFPAWMEIQYINNEPWYLYTFRWTLEDTRTGRVVWSTTSNSAHHKVEDRDKDAVGRAGEIVNRLITQMDVSGLFGAAPAAGTSR